MPSTFMHDMSPFDRRLEQLTQSLETSEEEITRAINTVFMLFLHIGLDTTSDLNKKAWA